MTVTVATTTVGVTVASGAGPLGIARGGLSGSYPSPFVDRMRMYELFTDGRSAGDFGALTSNSGAITYVDDNIGDGTYRGIAHLVTAAVNSSRATLADGIVTGSTIPGFIGAGLYAIDFEARVFVTQFGNLHVLHVGVYRTHATLGLQLGCCFSIEGGVTWRARTKSEALATDTIFDTGVNAADGFHTLRVRINANWTIAIYSIDGVDVATHAGGLPSQVAEDAAMSAGVDLRAYSGVTIGTSVQLDAMLVREFISR